MKRKLMILCAVFFALTLVGCKSNEKTFSKVGVTITLDESFIEKEVIQVPFYLESQDHLFMALRESKSELSNHGITTLDSYIKAVLNNNSKNGTIKTVEEDDLSYKYAYYTATVGDQSFGYMLVVMEGENYFYTMNFACLEDKLEDNKDLYFDWAKTITVK